MKRAIGITEVSFQFGLVVLPIFCVLCCNSSFVGVSASSEDLVVWIGGCGLSSSSTR